MKILPWSWIFKFTIIYSWPWQNSRFSTERKTTFGHWQQNGKPAKKKKLDDLVSKINDFSSSCITRRQFMSEYSFFIVFFNTPICKEIFFFFCLLLQNNAYIWMKFLHQAKKKINYLLDTEREYDQMCAISYWINCLQSMQLLQTTTATTSIQIEWCLFWLSWNQSTKYMISCVKFMYDGLLFNLFFILFHIFFGKYDLDHVVLDVRWCMFLKRGYKINP